MRTWPGATTLKLESPTPPTDPLVRADSRSALKDLEFANEALTAEGEAVDKSAPKRWRADAAAEKAEAFRKGR